jgi:hypothetical protein
MTSPRQLRVDRCCLRPQQGLDGVPLVHGLVALGGLLEGQFEVEDLAGVDLPGPTSPSPEVVLDA